MVGSSIEHSHNRCLTIHGTNGVVVRDDVAFDTVGHCLKDQDAGVPTAELARRHGVHPNTLRTWRAKYRGMESSDIARLKQLEEDNCGCGGL